MCIQCTAKFCSSLVASPAGTILAFISGTNPVGINQSVQEHLCFQKEEKGHPIFSSIWLYWGCPMIHIPLKRTETFGKTHVSRIVDQEANSMLCRSIPGRTEIELNVPSNTVLLGELLNKRVK